MWRLENTCAGTYALGPVSSWRWWRSESLRSVWWNTRGRHCKNRSQNSLLNREVFFQSPDFIEEITSISMDSAPDEVI